MTPRTCRWPVTTPSPGYATGAPSTATRPLRTSPSGGDTFSVTDELRIGPGTSIPLSEIELRASRSSGPGGQHANVTASRVEAVFEIEPSAALSEAQKELLRVRFGPRVTAVAQDARGQTRNRALALSRLADRIEAALRPRRPRRQTAPSRSARKRRLAEKRARGERKRDRGRPGANE